MNGPLLWIGLPAVIGGVLFMLRGYRLTTGLIGVILAAMLGISAWLLPVGEVITRGSQAFKISERFDTPVMVRMTTRVSHTKEDVSLRKREVPKRATFERNAATITLQKIRGILGMEGNQPGAELNKRRNGE